MSRVELSIRRLVVHGREQFDAEAFGGALEREVGRRLGEGSRVSTEAQADSGQPQRHASASAGFAGEAAHSVARRLFK